MQSTRSIFSVLVTFTMTLAFIMPAKIEGSGIVKLKHRKGGNLQTGSFSTCGPSPKVTFYVEYDGCPGLFPKNITCNFGGFGANPYRFRIKLLRDGQEVASREHKSSIAWTNTPIEIIAEPGLYMASVDLDKRTFVSTWKDLDSGSSGKSTVSRTPAHSSLL